MTARTADLSDEVLCERWVENPYYQYFCGEEFFRHQLVFVDDTLAQPHGRGAVAVAAPESLSVATRTKAIKS